MLEPLNDTETVYSVYRLFVNGAEEKPKSDNCVDEMHIESLLFNNPILPVSRDLYDGSVQSYMNNFKTEFSPYPTTAFDDSSNQCVHLLSLQLSGIK